ncbi:hypothetical protein CU098_004511 [Rhizopus stolonifer]|uniref:Homeobox domain-containing protein n=1 Tax=Rhizopus stolonifer TaxID=4846 RepID=A0A367ILM1_RHIST|nr:hypothetical protein CU098_004511 [Rhizopus stolonifer]
MNMTSEYKTNKKASRTIRSRKRGLSNVTLNFYNPFETRRRKKTSRVQVEVLERAFYENPKPDGEIRERLAHHLSMSTRCVQIWFQNRRVKEKNRKKREQGHPSTKGKDINIHLKSQKEMINEGCLLTQTDYTNEQVSLPYLPELSDQHMLQTPLFRLYMANNGNQYLRSQRGYSNTVPTGNISYYFQSVMPYNQIDGFPYYFMSGSQEVGTNGFPYYFMSGSQEVGTNGFPSGYYYSSTGPMTPAVRDWSESASGSYSEPQITQTTHLESMNTIEYSNIWKSDDNFVVDAFKVLEPINLAKPLEKDDYRKSMEWNQNFSLLF